MTEAKQPIGAHWPYPESPAITDLRGRITSLEAEKAALLARVEAAEAEVERLRGHLAEMTARLSQVTTMAANMAPIATVSDQSRITALEEAGNALAEEFEDATDEWVPPGYEREVMARWRSLVPAKEKKA